MKAFWNILITTLLLVLIVLVLRNNKQETELNIAFAERKVEEIPVRVEAVQYGTLSRELVFKDVIKPILELRLNAPVQGRVTKVFAKDGESIGHNALLIKTEDDYIQAEYKVDKQNFELAKKSLGRLDNLKEENAVPKSQYDQVAAQLENAEVKKAITEKRLNETWVRSPVSGFLNQMYVKEGMLINPSVPIAEIIDLSKCKIILFVSEFDVVDLKEAMAVEIIADTRPDESLRGEITSITRNVDFAMKYAVNIEFVNSTDWVRGGMSCKVIIPIKDEREGLLVPSQSLIKDSDSSFVYLVSQGIAKKTPVTVISENKGTIKVDGNFNRNDMVIVEGQTKLKNDIKIKIIE